MTTVKKAARPAKKMTPAKKCQDFSIVKVSPAGRRQGAKGFAGRVSHAKANRGFGREWAIHGNLRPEPNILRTGLVLSNLVDVSPKVTIEEIRISLKKGLEKEAFTRLADFLGVSQKKLSEVVDVNLRTLTRNNRLAPNEADRLLRVGTTFQEAVEVLEGLDAAREWFTSPQRALGQSTPLDYCDTEIGAREVTNLLGRIEYGVFS